MDNWFIKHHQNNLSHVIHKGDDSWFRDCLRWYFLDFLAYCSDTKLKKQFGLTDRMVSQLRKWDSSIVSEDKTEVLFIMYNAGIVKMYHDQDCCESVWLEDVQRGS